VQNIARVALRPNHPDEVIHKLSIDTKSVDDLED